MSYSLVLERMSGDLFMTGLAAIRCATHLRVLCSVPLLRVQYSKIYRELHRLRFMSRWCLSQKGMVFYEDLFLSIGIRGR